jgi:plastocyanin
MFQIGPGAGLISALFMAVFVAIPAYGDEAIEFYIKTVHVDGKTSIHGDANHKPEPFPGTKMPEGGGLVLTGPDAKGGWKIRAFTFQPSQMVVNEGDDVRLHFVGVQGRSHTIHIDGDGVDERFTLKRGTIKTVNIDDARAGVIEIECYDHQPAMNAEVFVFAKTN